MGWGFLNYICLPSISWKIPVDIEIFRTEAHYHYSDQPVHMHSAAALAKLVCTMYKIKCSSPTQGTTFRSKIMCSKVWAFTGK